MPPHKSPQYLEATVKIHYWKCNVIGHRHRSPESAASCMARLKGERGRLKKLKRNISMLSSLRRGETLHNIAKTHFCSEANVPKAVRAMLNQALKAASERERCPYEPRVWKRTDFFNPNYEAELNFLCNLIEIEIIQLEELLK